MYEQALKVFSALSDEALSKILDVMNNEVQGKGTSRGDSDVELIQAAVENLMVAREKISK